MVRRLFWFVTGAAVGVWATAKVNRVARRLTPDSLAAGAADKAVEAGARLKLFASDVRVGMTEREAQLNDALGLGATNPELPELPAPRRKGIARSVHNRKDDH
jgi:hypothetical protein